MREPFSARPLDSVLPQANAKEAIVAHTRTEYCTNRAAAETEIASEKSKELELIEKLKEQNFSAPIV